VQVDGNRIPKLPMMAEAIVKGDAKVQAISAASILAKTHRDAYMMEQAKKYPGYGFENHMGYGTAEHIKAVETLGVLPIHRKTFKPISLYCQETK
jgi:ribonuclease HII